jgi:hypothetical protein
MDEQTRGRLVTGSILIFLGLGLFALQFTSGFSTALLFFLIGGVFVASYLFTRGYGLLIPGGILMGLGLGQVGQSSNSIFSFEGFGAVGLGIGFCSIYVIDLIYRGRTSWWPLVPGLILIITGMASISAAASQLLSVGWPLLLVLVGLLVLAGAFGLGGSSRAARDHQDNQPEMAEDTQTNTIDEA